MKKNVQTPFRMSLIKVNHISKQINDSLNIYLVLRGQVTIKVMEKTHQLQEDDLLVINPFQQYEIISSEKNLCLSLQISSTQIKPYFEEGWVPYFNCDSSIGNRESQTFHEMRGILAHMMAVYFKNNNVANLEGYQYLFALLAHLSKFFLEEVDASQNLLQDVEDDRLQMILTKLQRDYQQVISLESLSEESGLSYHYLSRTFKKKVGMTFTEYLNQIRLIHATEELLLTDESLISIALNNGFSNAKHFHQVFKKYYNLTPSAFRKANKLVTKQKNDQSAVSRYEELSGQMALQELAKYLVEKDIDDENVALDEALSIDLSQPAIGEFTLADKIIKIGLARELLDSGVQGELKILQAELAFDYVQFEGFCEETNFHNDGTLLSEYLLNNRAFDFLVSIKLTPLIQLRLPKEAATLEEVEAWCNRQLQLFKHFMNRYGVEALEKWAIQWVPPYGYRIWDERSSWGYRYVYQKIKKLNGKCQVGLFTLACFDEEESQAYAHFLQQQGEGRCLPDFLCFHADPYQSPAVSDNYPTRFKEYQQLILAEVKAGISAVQKKLANDQWSPAIYLTEWNTLVGEGSTLSGTFFRSALILESMIELSREIDGLAYWLNIKVKERQTKKREESSLSVFLYDELRRPLFFSLSFLNRLEGEVIESGAGYMLTQTKNCHQLLVYNSNYLDPQYSVDTIQVGYQSKKLSISLDNVAAGTYIIRHYILDKDHGGIYNDWIRVGGQVEIDGELQAYLEQKILPKFDITKEEIKSGRYQIETTLTLNACQLYVLQKRY